MAGKSILLGTSTRYDGGVVSLGQAPAKVTAVTLKKGNKGEVKFVIALPTDPVFRSYVIYALDSTSLTEPTFPGGSPIYRGTDSKPDDFTAKPGVRRHYWIVTRDRYDTPTSPVAANAFWAGSIIPSLSSTLSAS